jgi:hypothetical protein
MSDWISVDVELPEPGVEVLINGSEGVEIASYSAGEGDQVDQPGHDPGFIGYKYAMPGRSWGTVSCMQFPQGQPTHWMPLPDAPEIEDDSDTYSCLACLDTGEGIAPDSRCPHCPKKGSHD